MKPFDVTEGGFICYTCNRTCFIPDMKPPPALCGDHCTSLVVDIRGGRQGLGIHYYCCSEPSVGFDTHIIVPDCRLADIGGLLSDSDTDAMSHDTMMLDTHVDTIAEAVVDAADAQIPLAQMLDDVAMDDAEIAEFVAMAQRATSMLRDFEQELAQNSQG